jgi:tetratricopeptide (TPR) repeat protein
VGGETPAEKGQPARRSIRPWLLGAGAVLLVGAAAVWMLRAPGSGDAASSHEPPAVTRPAPRAEVVGQRPAPAPAPAAAGGPRQIEALLASGEAALGAGDYAAAVVAFDKVLEIVPDHPGAAARMHIAAEGYRVQKERQEKWAQVVAAFDNQQYTDALRFLYRLPEGVEPEHAERLKTAAWYNLGVLALQGSDCQTAVSHFEEARTVAPGDRDVQAAMQLARTCDRSPAFRAAVERLAQRQRGGRRPATAQ